MKAYRLFLIPAAGALVALTGCATRPGPGQVEAVRGQNTFTRDGMTRKMMVASSVQGGEHVSTGSDGQSQIDAGSTTLRAGPSTSFDLNQSRDGLTLNQGIVLVSNKSKGQGFGLETDRHEATCYGTMQVSYKKDKYLKVLCVEGKVKVGLKALMGDSVTLTPGQMVVITPTEDRLPDPVTVDLNRVAATSMLMGPGFVVPSMSFPGGPRVTRAIASQEQGLAQGSEGSGQGSRDTMTAESPETLRVLSPSTLPGSGSAGSSFTPATEFSIRLGSRPPTIENMFDVLDEARRGVPLQNF